MLTGAELFAGIGGFSIAMKRAGIRPVWAAEIDERCQEVLRTHHPEMQVFGDVRSIGSGIVPRVDILCGGFPCQSVSIAGKRKAQEDFRWLWPEFARLIRELRPRYVLVENVNPGLRAPVRVLDADKKLLGFRPAPIEEVLGDLAACGYDTEWDCVPASAVGAPHQRDRIWIVAYPHADNPRLEGWFGAGVSERAGERPLGAVGAYVADAHGERSPERGQRPTPAGEGSGRGDDRAGSGDVAGQERVRGSGEGAGDVADAYVIAWRPRGTGDAGEGPRGRDAGGSGLGTGDVEDANSRSVLSWGRWGRATQASDAREWWSTEPGMGRVAHGVPDRVDRLTELGNSLVPQVAEIFTRCIAEHAMSEEL